MWTILLTLVIQRDTHQHHHYQLAESDNWKIGCFLQMSMLLAGYDREALKNWWNVHATGAVIIKKVCFCRWYQNQSCIDFSFKIEFPLFSHSAKFMFLQMLNLYIPKAWIRKQTSLFPNYLWQNQYHQKKNPIEINVHN